MKRVYVNEKWCLGCHLCEYYCAFAGTDEKDMARALKDIKINPRIKIEEQDGVSFAVSCRHCREPLCVKGCITGALTITGGVITIDKYTFMSLDDAHRLGAALGREKRVLIVGAGLVGLKCAEGILDRVSHITVLVLAVGVRPNTGLLKCVCEIDRGIVTGSRSETSAPDIYAAGDCTQTMDVSSGQSRIMALLPNAYMQGECAGVNMAGGEKSFDKAIPMNAIGFFGLHIITAGSCTGDVYAETGEGSYKRLFYGDSLNGYILIGNVARAGIYTSLIRERTPLDSIDFGLVCEKPGLMAFTKEDRISKLGEAK